MQCGACQATTPDDGEFCGHCGIRLRAPADLTLLRFDAAMAHPDYAAAYQHKPTPLSQRILVPSALIVVVGVCLAATMVVLSLNGFWMLLVGGGGRPRSEWLTIALFCLPFVFMGGYMMVQMSRDFMADLKAISTAPVARVALVVGERTAHGQSGKHHYKVYFVTLQTRDGVRTEYQCSRATVKAVAEGDIGVVHLQADRLLAFRRVDV